MKTINVSGELHTLLKVEASKRGISIQELLTEILEKYFKQKESYGD